MINRISLNMIKDNVIDVGFVSPMISSLTQAVNTTAIGVEFNSIDSDGIGPYPGVRWIYERTNTPPFYTPVREWADSDDIGLFSALNLVAIPNTRNGFFSSGYSVSGVGGGYYISDSLATSSLATAHPRFCKATKNGRYFRLVPHSNMITVEQGGALGDPDETNSVNEQPIFQAAISYCRAMNIWTLGLSAYAYSIWMTTRTSQPQVNFFHTFDGQPLIVESDQQVRILSLHPTRSRLNYRNNNGQSLAGTTGNTNFQVVSSEVWRGCGIVVKTTETDPGEGKRSHLTVERVILNGGTLKSSYFGWPARTSDGDGWDTTHKGISVEADKTYGGNVSVIDSDIIGWRGESIYSANNTRAKLFIRNSYMAESNGQAVNSNGCQVDIEFRAKNCFLGIEGWTGDKGGRVVADLDNCYGVLGVSGQAFSLQGGKYGSSTESPYYTPTRINANEAPIGTIDIIARNCSPAFVGSWLTGKFTGIDTNLTLGGSVFGAGAFDVDLDAVFVTDQTTNAYPQVFGGFGGTQAAGDRRTANINLRVSHTRTKVAIAASRKARLACGYYGSLGKGIYIDIQGALHCQRPPSPDTTVLDYVPTFTGDIMETGDYSNSLQNAQTTPAIALRSPIWGLYTDGAGIYNITATGMSNAYSTGDRILIINANGNGGGTIAINGSKTGGSGFYSPNGWFIIPPGARQWVVYDGNFFVPERPLNIGYVSNTGATSYTPSISDLNQTTRFTSSSAITYTVPNNTSAAYPVGTVLEIEQASTGVVTIVAASGVTLLSRGGLLSTNGQYATVRLRKNATNEWTVFGDRV